jgi:endo-1,4-beta-D-glucanase Y
MQLRFACVSALVLSAILAGGACKGGIGGGGDDEPADDDPDARPRSDARVDAGDDDGEPDARRADARVDARPPGPGEPDASTGGCARNGDAAQPFGNHVFAYTAGVILPDVPAAEMDRAVSDFYETWKDRHLRQGCGSGRYYVDYNGRNETVSEAHGYGMLIAVFMAGYDDQAKTIFDGMVRYFQEHRSNIQGELMAWRQAGCNSVDGINSATDGDLDIAYALLLADKQWGSGGALNYRSIAEDVIDGIMAGDVDATKRYLLLGDWTGDSGQLHDATRPSDFMPGHIASFQAVAGNDWKTLLDSQYSILQTAQNRLGPNTGLVSDFLINPLGNVTAPNGELLEDAGDDDYEYNACRVPWRIATHYITSGDTRAKTIAGKMASWIRSATGGDPGNISAAYQLSGAPLPGFTYTDMTTVAPFAVASMLDGGNRAWLNDLWDFIVDDGGGGYYGDTIKLLSMIVISGNWWTPEAAPCE